MKRCLLFFEKDSVDSFYPLSPSHTPAELRCGILNLGDKWQARLKADSFAYLTRPEIADHVAGNTGVDTNVIKQDEFDQFIVIDPCYLPNNEVAARIAKEEGELALFVDGNPVLVMVDNRSALIETLASKLSGSNDPGFARSITDAASALPRNDIDLDRVDYLWDLVHANGDQIKSDFEFLASELNFSDMHHVSDIDESVVLYAADDIYIDRNCRIDSQVVIDARGGPVFIGRETIVTPHTRIEGPAFIGDFCQLVGGKVREGCSFGPHCRVGGEVEESIFQGYSNKYHEGFIGHAYLGEWVNLGALTTNSDLKNNYSDIKVELPQGLIDTGFNKIGSFIGDHAKTGIGTLLNTGMVIGFASNIFGGGMVMRKSLPSFVWGSTSGFVDYNVEKALQTAGVVMSRRGRELKPATERLFRDIFVQAAEARLEITRG